MSNRDIFDPNQIIPAKLSATELMDKFWSKSDKIIWSSFERTLTALEPMFETPELGSKLWHHYMGAVARVIMQYPRMRFGDVRIELSNTSPPVQTAPFGTLLNAIVPLHARLESSLPKVSFNPKELRPVGMNKVHGKLLFSIPMVLEWRADSEMQIIIKGVDNPKYHT